MKKVRVFLMAILVSLLCGVGSVFSQNFKPFEVYYQETLKGDMLLVGNSILQASNIPINNRPGSNENVDMIYVNVDPGSDRFSSSAATIDYSGNTCMKVKKAFLYWSAVWTDEKLSPRQPELQRNLFNTVKFKTPTSGYVDITGTYIYNDNDVLSPGAGGNRAQKAYACVADVTDLLLEVANTTGRNGNFEGEYIVANLRAAYGREANTGYAGGWFLYVIYEDVTLPSKNISVFNGMSVIRNGNSVDINVEGFQTIPTGSVNAKFAFGALEGEQGKSGDGLRINNTLMSAPGRPSRDFFNSKLTGIPNVNGVNASGEYINRRPAFTNLLGFDAGIFKVDNPGNSVIKNNDTQAKVTIFTQADVIYPFMMTFNVEVIEPKIVMEKKVLNSTGIDTPDNDLTGEGVELKQQLYYQLKFRNVGNDDAIGLKIKDNLPQNVHFEDIAANVSMPAGVTYTYVPYDANDPANSHYIEFDIPPSYVTKGHEWETIQFLVKVAENCDDMRDACSNDLKNIAYVTYRGRENATEFVGESIRSYAACDGSITGPSNFIVDIDECVSKLTSILCGSEVDLTAGSGFDTYEWTKIEGVGADPTAIIGRTQTLTVTSIGKYKVVKTGAGASCPDSAEEIEVILHAEALQTNPINAFASEVKTCADNGWDYPQIYLCGSDATKNLTLSLTNVVSYSWGRRTSNEVPTSDSCPVYEGATWQSVNTSQNYEVSDAGDYRLVLTFQNGCVTTYYFKVTKATLSPVPDIRNIICNTPGRIEITGVSSGYEYALQGSDGAIVQPYQDSNVFTVTTPDLYKVLIKQKLATSATYEPCIFEVSAPVRALAPVLTVTSTPLYCHDSKGAVRVQFTDAYGPYTFRLYSGTSLVGEKAAVAENDVTFEGLNAGTYRAEVTTPDGCSESETVEVVSVPPMVLTARVIRHFMCGTAAVRVDVTGGTRGQSYAYSIDGGANYYYNYDGAFYEFVDDITAAGTYTIDVVDAQGCAASTTVTVDALPVPAFDTQQSLQNCAASATLEFINLTNVADYTLRYSVDGVNFQNTATFANLVPGNTYTPTLLYSMGTASCTISDTVTIDKGNGAIVAAFAGVSKLVGCGDTGANAGKAQVRVTNVQGGTLPYQYSFDNKATWVTTNEGWVSPGTNLSIFVRDANECEYEMKVTVEDAPVAPVFTSDVVYNCDGTGNITILNNQSTFEYTYSMDGGTTTQTSSAFDDIAPGTYTVTITFARTIVPTPSVLFLENFGTGANTTTQYINNAYFYEPQNRTASSHIVNGYIVNGYGQTQNTNPGMSSYVSNLGLNDGEYVVSRRLNPNNGAWTAPNDHSKLTDGRMLFVNVGNVLGQAGGILYQRQMNDIDPTRPIEFSMAVMNLMRVTGNPATDNNLLSAPDMAIELYANQAAVDAVTPLLSRRYGSNTPPYAGRTPRSNNADDWTVYSNTLNVQGNTSLIAVIRSYSLITSGNDLALDDIYLYQNPEICPDSYDISVTVAGDRAFGIDIPSENVVNNICSGETNGSYSINLYNFDTTNGYAVSTDNGTTWTRHTANPYVWNNLADGAYTVMFRYDETSTNCEFIRNFTITSPNPIVLDTNIPDQVLRCDQPSVSVNVSATGGTGALQYTLTQPDGTSVTQPSQTFAGLTQIGTYTVGVTDANGCTATMTASFNVTAAPTLTTTLDTANSNLCYQAGAGASIKVDVTGGTASYTYIINGNTHATTTNASHTFTGLVPGTYTIIVRDIYGCDDTFTQVIAPQLDATNAVIAKPITCGTTPSGQIDITITGGTVPYTYTVNGGTSVNVTGNTITYNTDVAGVYNFVITDAEDCTTAVSRELVAPVAPTATVTSQVDVKCFGDATGSFTVNVTGGVAPYTYIINGVDRGNQNTFNNLSAGTYTVLVRDAYECESAVETVTITQPVAALTATATVKTLVSCSPDNTAQVLIEVSGGTPDYTDNLSGGNVGYTASRTVSLAPGTHTIRITDAEGCQTSVQVVVPGRPQEPVVAASAVTYACDGTGTFTLTPANTTDFSYEYSLDNGTTYTTTATFTNMVPGIHRITVRYKQLNLSIDEDCGYTMVVPVTVAAGEAFSVGTPQSVNVTCNGGNDGSFTVNVSNFDTTSGYRYQVNGGAWTNGTTSPISETGLTAGTYTLTVEYINTDGTADCQQEVSIRITEPDAITLTPIVAIPIMCSNTGARINVTASGGTAPYTYSINGGAFSSNAFFTDVADGIHTITVRDRNNCEEDTTITVDAPKTVSFTTTTAACYSGNNDGEITVTVTDGNGGYQFSINNGAWQTPSATATMTYTFDELNAGTYTIRVRDAYGCDNTNTVAINPNLVVNVQTTNISCKDGLIAVTAQGGAGDFRYAFVTAGTAPTTTDYTTTATYSVATVGSYDVYVADRAAIDEACIYSETVTIGTAPDVTHTATVVNPTCHGGTGRIDVSAVTGDGPYTVAITNQTTPGVNESSTANYVGTTYNFTGLQPDTYLITITDRYGCTSTSTHTVTELPAITASIATVLPSGCITLPVNPDDFGITFTVPAATLTAYQTAGYDLYYSVDNGATWTSSTTVMGFTPGEIIRPRIKTVIAGAGASGAAVCDEALPSLVMTLPLSELAVSPDILTVGNACTGTGFSVEVTASGGVPGYWFTMDDPFGAAPVWHAATHASGTHSVTGTLDRYTFTNLVPGRSYNFYVRDANGCIQQNKQDVYEGYTPTVSITPTVTPACFGAATGSIDFVITSSYTTATTFDYQVYSVNPQGGAGTPIVNPAGSGTGITMPLNGAAHTITVLGLPVNTFYYIEITEASGCKWASANAEVYVLPELGGTPEKIRDVTCALPGIIAITNPIGGGGTYEYRLTSPAFVTPIGWTSNSTIEVPIANINTTIGTVTVEVFIRDQYGCDKKLDEVTLNVATNPTILSATPDSCTEPLSITVLPGSGAVTDYLYSIDNGVTWLDNGGVFTNLLAAVYNVTIRDKATGCEAATPTAVTLHDKLQASVLQTAPITCGATPGAIQINVTAGSGNYDYEVQVPTGAISVTKTNLPTNPYDFTMSVAGTYTITLYDNGTACPGTVFTVNVPEAVRPFFTLQGVEPSCNGGADGRILITETDTGVGAYTYTSPGLTYSAATQSFENISAGTYIITSTAANGCVYTDTVTVGEPTVLTIGANLATMQQFACTSGNTMNEAIVSVDLAQVSGGTGPYRYEIVYDNATPGNTTDDVTVQNTNLVISNPLGGIATIIVYDANGCDTQTTTTITPYDELQTVTSTVATAIVCGGTETINIIATSTANVATKWEYIQSDTAPALADPAWQTSNQFTGLAIGLHTFWVKHVDTGCMLSVVHEVKDPNTFRIGDPTITHAVCVGDNGTATFTLTNTEVYTGNYDYVVQGTAVAGTAVANQITVSLPAGTYILVVTQDSAPGCEQTYPFTITEPTASLTASRTVSDITCASATNGVIEVINAEGGWGNYAYYVGTNATPAVTDFVATPRFANLGVGTYHVFVRDGRGCQGQLADVTLALPDPITATLSVTTQNCTAGSGVIEVLNTQGGQGYNYTYQLVRNGTNYGAPQTATTFSNLPSGTYTVRITDGWTCSATITAGVDLYEPLTANPLIVINKEITCTVPQGAEIEIRHTGGSASITYTVTSADNSYNQSQVGNRTFTGLTYAGAYTVTLFDAVTGCNTVTTTFDLADVIPVTFTHTQENVKCAGGNDGKITVTLPATNTQVPYVLTLESALAGFTTRTQTVTSYPSTNIFDGLSAATYTLAVISDRGCVSSTTVVITEPAVLTIDSTLTNATAFACNTTNVPQVSTLTVVVNGGTAPHYYSIDNIDFSNTTGVFTIFDTGAVQNITVYVKDANGCTVDNSATPIVIQPLPKITGLTALQTAAITCNNPETVAVTVTGGGANGFTVDVQTTAATPVSPQTIAAGTTVANFTLTEPGQYIFTVTDLETNCYTSTMYMIDAYDTIQASATMSSTVTCSGASDGTIELTVTGYTGAFNYEVLYGDGVTPLSPVAAGNTTAPTLISGIPAGTWMVRVTATDAPFCTTDSGIVYVVGPTQALTVAATLANDLTCDGNDALISVSAEGGWGGYEYRLLLGGTAHPVYGTYTTTAQFAGLDAGAYTVWVRDTSGCEASAAADVTIVTPTPIRAGITSSGDVTCYGDQTATVEAVGISGGSGTYLYALISQTASGTTESAAQVSPIFSGLGAGEYSIKVIDGWNCDALTASVTINEPDRIEVLAVITQTLTCNNLVTVELSATGGSGGYAYSTSAAGPFTANNIFTGLGVGTHTFYAIDINGCTSEVSNSIVIDPIVPLTLDVDTTAAYVTCNGESTASIRATASGGLGNYQYELLDGANNPFTPQITNADGIFGGLATGTYTVKVTSVDCEYITPQTITITEAPALITDTATSTNVTCNGNADGTIEVLVSGGTGSITYAISPRLDRFETINRFENLAPDTYVVLAQDANGCFVEFEFVITEPTALTVTEVTVTNEVCLGAEDGTATITVSGGVAPYRTLLNDNSATATWVEGKFFYDNLPAGRNVIFVRDANDCETHVILTEVLPGVDLTATATVTYGCSNNSNVIQNTVTASVNPLYAAQVTYSLNGGTPTNNPVFTNVAAGTHTITVSHNGGCIVDVPVTVDDVQPLSFTQQTGHVSCHGANDGIFTIQVTGGSGEYRYAVSPDLTFFDTANQFPALNGGTYTIIIRDEKYGCQTQTTFTINEPTELELSVYTVTNETCYAQNDGLVTFEIKGSTPNYTYSLVNSQGTEIRTESNLIVGTVVTLNNLVPDTYTLNYADSGACSGTTQITIAAAPNLLPTSVRMVYECPTVIGNAPTNYLEVVFDNTVLTLTNTTYALNTTNSANAVNFSEFNGNTAIIRNLPAGAGQFITLFHNGCQTTINASQYFDVEAYTALTLADVSDAAIVNQIKVEAQGGAAPYTYYFNGANYGSNGEYFVKRSDPGYVDANGRQVKQITVTVVDDLGCEIEMVIEKIFIDVRIPDHFTPNDDGNNDTWSPENTATYPNIETRIYDRYGRLLATIRRGQTWDGRYDGKHLPAGDYWYIIRLNEDEDDSREFVGHFTLYR